LTQGPIDLPERQQTLRRTIQWSYELLKPEEQRLFQRMSVFADGATLAAVEAVCEALGDETGRVFDGVASLLDKCLIQAQGDEEQRLLMLETIREYGLEALEASGEGEVTRQAHATYYLRLAEEAEPELTGPQQVTWLERLEQQYDNLRAALQWSLDQAGDEEARPSREMALRLAGALRLFWVFFGHWSEGRTFLERALVGSKDTVGPVQVKALKAAAHLVYLQGDIDRAEVLSEECLARCRELGDTAGIALSLRLLGAITAMRGNFVVASSLTEEALVLFREVGNKEGIAWSLYNLAGIVRDQGEYTRAISLNEEALAIFRKVGDIRGIAWSLFGLAWVLIISQGDPAKVHTLLEEGLALCRGIGHKVGIVRALRLLGEAFLQQGNTIKARLLMEENVTLSRGIGYRYYTAESFSLLGRVTASQGDYTTARAFYKESLVIGREVGDKLSIAFCLEGLADVVAVQGEPAWAAQLWGAAESLREAMGTPLPPVYRPAYERSVAAARTQLGEQTFATAWSEGRTMTPEQALAAEGIVTIPAAAVGQSCIPQAPKASTFPNGLTAREMEVLQLLAQGLTSAQMAEQLILSRLTINTHVRSIYSKLGVTSRSSATRWALENKLV
jgi:ATP/maltotriose-dependent transcriptional regulator MalT